MDSAVMRGRMATKNSLISDLEVETINLAEDYHVQGLSPDEIIAAVRVGLTAFVRLLEERKN